KRYFMINVPGSSAVTKVSHDLFHSLSRLPQGVDRAVVEITEGAGGPSNRRGARPEPAPAGAITAALGDRPRSGWVLGRAYSNEEMTRQRPHRRFLRPPLPLTRKAYFADARGRSGFTRRLALPPKINPITLGLHPARTLGPRTIPG